MNRIVFIVVLAACVCVSFRGECADTVKLRSTSSSTYENGRYEPALGEYEASYRIDEDEGTITPVKVTRNSREGRAQEYTAYEITGTVIGKGLSGLLVSREKKGQKIITAVRDLNVGITEIMIIGETFYQFCRAANGKFYLESGDVKK